MSRQIKIGEEAQKAHKVGIDAVASMVLPTLGPAGGNVLIEREYESPLYTNDGMTAGCSVSLPDPFENMGCDLAKNVLIRAHTDSKGSRTTAFTLFHSFIHSGQSPTQILETSKKAAELLEKDAKKIESEEQLIALATISSGNTEIGEMIGKAVYAMGSNAALTVQESRIPGIRLEIESGMQLDIGFKESDQKEIIMNKVVVYLAQKVLNVLDINNLIQVSIQNGVTDLFIMAEDVSKDGLELLDMNRLNKSFNGIFVPIPGYGSDRKEILKDISILCNTKISTETPYLGVVDKIVITKDSTLIFNPKDTEIVKERISELQELLKSEADEYEKEKLMERIANLSSGIGVMYIGGYSDSAIKVLIQKAQDAIHESKSALEFGYIQGAGVALMNLRHINKCLSAPYQQIIDNGADIKLTESSINLTSGHDNLILVNPNIIDSLKTVQNALLFASAEASIFLTNRASNAHIPKKND